MAKRGGKGRDRGLEQAWRRRLARYGSSGLTVREFCEGEEVPETSFYHWRRELAVRDDAATRRRPASVSGQAEQVRRTTPLFLPVSVKEAGLATPAEGIIELQLPSGHVLRGGEVEKLARLAVLLDGSSC